MNEFDPHCDQHQMCHSCVFLILPIQLGISVFHIANNWMSDSDQMSPNLMKTACMRLSFKQRTSRRGMLPGLEGDIESFDRSIGCLCFLRCRQRIFRSLPIGF